MNKIKDLSTPELKIKFLESALAEMISRLESSDSISALSLGKACLIGLKHGVNSLEFNSYLAIEAARLSSMDCE